MASERDDEKNGSGGGGGSGGAETVATFAAPIGIIEPPPEVKGTP